MGKMSKKNLDELKRDDVKENNWEIEEEGTRSKEQVCDPVPEKKELTAEDILAAAITQVDPEIRKDNPVWQYKIKEKEVVIVFRNGQKVRIPRG